MEQGLTHIYTGNGKGKTTCSVGLAVRALGSGLKVLYVYLHKNPEKHGYSELNMLEQMGATVMGFAHGTPLFNKSLTKQQLTDEVEQAINVINKKTASEKYDLLVVDEFNIAVSQEYLTEKKAIEFIVNKPRHTELVLTGRGATDALIDAADYVTRFEKQKHPFDKGIASRKGIEF